MDRVALVTPDEIELGRQVLDALSSDADLKLRSALWIFNENLQQWRFTISTPYYEKKGAQAAYLRIRKILKKQELLGQMPLDRISLIEDNHPILVAIRDVFGQLNGVSLVNCSANGTKKNNSLQ